MTPALSVSRRQLLLGAATTAGPLALGLPAFAWGAGKAEALNALLDGLMQENLKADPAYATSLGLDVGPLAGLKHKVEDVSLEGVARHKARRRSQLDRLTAFGRDGLQGLDAVNYDAVMFGLTEGAAADAAFDLGVAGASSPYVLSQLTGAYQDMPTFLDTKHGVKTADDADAYIDRLQGFAVMLDQETDCARHDAAKGMIPPDFILDKALEQMRELQAQGPDVSILVTSIARKAREAKLDGDYGAKAAAVYAAAIQPALQRQIAQVEAMRAKATHVAGVGARPQGEAFYAAGLKHYTTSSITPEEVHRIGLEQTRDYQARIDTILKAQGLTQGSVGARITALSTDPRYLWPDTDAGKATMIAHLNDLVAQITPRLPRMFRKPPTVPLEIRRVPPYIEAGAPLGYYNSASLDGTRPAIYYINLQHTIDWPRWLVSSVTFHEGVPGHHLQISTAQHIPNLPLIRKTGGYSGYAEGWALYAEQLADELGMYDDDPLGRVGYLKSELWRACRMVLDTGVHLMGWSREDAIRWKMDNDGSLEGGAANEVERYCVWPGQAPSYKIGHTVINRLRDGWKARLGERFDIKDFHEAMLDRGSLPLDVLERVAA
ncbi:MAG: DUF885 family protein [Caulobacteraceae bacterium]